jgi:hypothetical protein
VARIRISVWFVVKHEVIQNGFEEGKQISNDKFRFPSAIGWSLLGRTDPTDEP